MLETATQPSTDRKNEPLKHFVWGLIPAGIAGLALLIHAIEPFIPHEHQGVFITVIAMLGNGTLAYWVWCAVQAVSRKFENRIDAQDDALEQLEALMKETLRLVGHLENSIQALHKKLDNACTERKKLKEEVEHLRSLIIEEPESLNGQRLGPRALN